MTVPEKLGWSPRSRRRHLFIAPDGSSWHRVCDWRPVESVSVTPPPNIVALAPCRKCIESPHREAAKWLV